MPKPLAIGRRLEFDRRTHNRYVLLLEGRLKFKSPAEESRPRRVSMSNIGLNGMMLHADNELGTGLRLGEVLQLEFTAPFSNGPVRIEAFVEWKTRTRHNMLGAWAFGVSFVEPKSPQIRRLYDPVSRLWEGVPDTGC